MRIDPAGWPFILGGLVLAIVALWLFKPLIGITLLIVTTFFLFFFRDPDRRVVAPDTAVLSPADGRVMVAGPSTSPTFSSGQWQQISIFLSPMDDERRSLHESQDAADVRAVLQWHERSRGSRACHQPLAPSSLRERVALEVTW